MIEPMIRSGPGYWWAGYRAQLRFEVVSLRAILIFALLIQLLMSAGMVYMYGFYLGDLPPESQAFLVSGIPTLALVPIGFVMIPSVIISQKIRETYDFVWSLPVPRMASAMATFTVFSALSLPGTALGLWLATLRYEVDLRPSWMLLPAVALSSLMATSVGFGLGHAIPEPRVTNLITNMLIFLVLLFSPIIVPIEQFPDGWAIVHRVLPFWHMANVVRAALTDGLVDSVGASYAVLAAWTVAAWLVAGWAVGRRK